MFFSKLIKYLPHREIFNIRVVDLNNYTFISRVNSQKTSHLLKIRVKIYSVLCLQHRIYCDGNNNIKFSAKYLTLKFDTKSYRQSSNDVRDKTCRQTHARFHHCHSLQYLVQWHKETWGFE
jgi:hypothetical protein